MKQKFYFDHLGKTGGTTVHEALRAVLGENRVSGMLATAYRNALLALSTVDLVTAHTVFLEGDRLAPDVFHFTIVRDPVARFISEYWHFRTDKRRAGLGIAARAKQLALGDFFSSLDAQERMTLCNAQTRHFAERFNPQATGDGQMDLLSRAQISLAEYDLVGITTELDGFVDLLCLVNRWEIVVDLPLLNASRADRTAADGGAALRARILEASALDQALFEKASILFKQARRTQYRSLRGSVDVPAPGGTECVEAPASSPVRVFPPREFGNRRATVEAVEVFGDISLGSMLLTGELASFCISVHAHQAIPDLTVGIAIRNRLSGELLYGVNSRLLGTRVEVDNSGRFRFVFEMLNSLGVGEYIVDVSLHSGVTHTAECYHWKEGAAEFSVDAMVGRPFEGRMQCSASFRLLGEAADIRVQECRDGLNALQKVALHTPLLSDFAFGLRALSSIDRLAPGEVVLLEAVVRNLGTEVWPVVGLRPVRISYHWFGADGAPKIIGGLRTELAKPLRPQGEERVHIKIKAPDVPGSYLLMLTVLQENHAWFEPQQPGSSAFAVVVTGADDERSVE